MMKKIAIVLLMGFSFLSNAQETKKAFIIKGQVEGDYSGYVFLKTTDAVIKDSCLVVNNKFNFSGNIVGSAQATLALKPVSTVAFFYLENSPIEISVATSTFKNGNEDVNDIEIKKISGSKTQELMLDVENYQKEIEKSAISKEEKNKKIYKKYYEAVISNPEYLIADFLIDKSKKKGTLTPDQVKDLTQFSAKKKAAVASLKDTLKIENKAELSKKLDPGKIIEKFTLNNEKGKKVNITDFKGKYVLINFWASWYKPTRKNNAELVKIHEKYKNKKFEIVSISIDTYEKNWTDAIEKDKLNWTNLIDTDGWHGKVVTQFEIKGIPLNILLDRKGKIIAVNVWKSALDEKLDYYLNVLE